MLLLRRGQSGEEGVTPKRRDLRCHLSGVLISQLGDQVQGATLSISIYVQTHDAWATCIVALIRLLTMALGTWIGGRVTDRFARRTILVCVQIPLFLVPAYLAWWSFQYGSLSVAMVDCLLVLVYSLMAMEGNTQAVISQHMVSREEVANVIYISSILRNLAMTLGSLGSGLLIILSEELGWLFAFNAVSYIPLLIFYLGMPYGRERVLVRKDAEEQQAPKVTYQEAKVYLRKQNPVGYRAYHWAWLWHLTTTNGQLMYILISYNLLGGTKAYTALTTAAAIGGALVTILFSWVAKRHRSGKMAERARSIRPMFAWGCVLGASYLIVLTSQNLWISVVMQICTSFGIYGMTNVLAVLIQCGTRSEENVERAYEGRIKGLPALVNALGGVVCNLVSCVLFQITGDVRSVGVLALVGLLGFSSGLLVEVRYEVLLALVHWDLISVHKAERIVSNYRKMKHERHHLYLWFRNLFCGVLFLAQVIFPGRRLAER